MRAAAITTAAGPALMVPGPIALAGPAATIAGVEITMRLVEEPYLRRLHGDARRHNAARVGRFLPGLGRLH